MSKVKIVSIIYAIGIIIGALFFDVWGEDTTPFKTLSVFTWTIIFIIAIINIIVHVNTDNVLKGVVSSPQTSKNKAPIIIPIA